MFKLYATGKIRKIKPDGISPGGTRRYNQEKILRFGGKELPQIEKDERITLACAGVRSPDRKEDLKRPSQVLELYCAERGCRTGMNL